MLRACLLVWVWISTTEAAVLEKACDTTCEQTQVHNDIIACKIGCSCSTFDGGCSDYCEGNNTNYYSYFANSTYHISSDSVTDALANLNSSTCIQGCQIRDICDATWGLSVFDDNGNNLVRFNRVGSSWTPGTASSTLVLGTSKNLSLHWRWDAPVGSTSSTVSYSIGVETSETGSTFYPVIVSVNGNSTGSFSNKTTTLGLLFDCTALNNVIVTMAVALSGADITPALITFSFIKQCYPADCTGMCRAGTCGASGYCLCDTGYDSVPFCDFGLWHTNTSYNGTLSYPTQVEISDPVCPGQEFYFDFQWELPSADGYAPQANDWFVIVTDPAHLGDSFLPWTHDESVAAVVNQNWYDWGYSDGAEGVVIVDKAEYPYRIWTPISGSYLIGYYLNNDYIPKAFHQIPLLSKANPLCWENGAPPTTCVHGTLVGNQCECDSQFFGNNCEHGCESSYYLSGFGGVIYSSESKQPFYIGKMTCAWSLEPTLTVEGVGTLLVRGITFSYSLGLDRFDDALQVFRHANSTAQPDLLRSINGIVRQDDFTVNSTTANLVFTSGQYKNAWQNVNGIFGFRIEYYANGCPAGALVLLDPVTEMFSCTLCPEGTYSPTADFRALECLKCPAGTYGDEVGLSACKPFARPLQAGDKVQASFSAPLLFLSLAIAIVAHWVTLILVEDVVFAKSKRKSVKFYLALCSILTLPSTTLALVVALTGVSIVAVPLPKGALPIITGSIAMHFNIPYVLLSLVASVFSNTISMILFTANLTLPSAHNHHTPSQQQQHQRKLKQARTTSNTNNNAERSKSTEQSSGNFGPEPPSPHEKRDPNCVRRACKHFLAQRLISPWSVSGAIMSCVSIVSGYFLVLLAVVAPIKEVNFSAAIIAGVALTFVLCFAAQIGTFHLFGKLRFFTSLAHGAAIILTFVIFMATITAVYDPQLPTAGVDKTSVWIGASLITTVVCFSFLALQFFRLRLSRNAMHLVLRKARAQNEELEKEVIRQHESLTHHRFVVDHLNLMLDLINQARPIPRAHAVARALKLLRLRQVTQSTNDPNSNQVVPVTSPVSQNREFTSVSNNNNNNDPTSEGAMAAVGERGGSGDGMEGTDVVEMVVIDSKGKKQQPVMGMEYYMRTHAEKEQELAAEEEHRLTTLEDKVNDKDKDKDKDKDDKDSDDEEDAAEPEEGGGRGSGVGGGVGSSGEKEEERESSRETNARLVQRAKSTNTAGVAGKIDKVAEMRLLITRLAGPSKIDDANLPTILSKVHDAVDRPSEAQGGEKKSRSMEMREFRWCLAHPVLLEMLKDLMTSKHSEESLMCFLDVVQYRRTSKAGRKQMGAHIWDTFLKKSAPFEVNVSAAVQKAVEGQIKKEKWTKRLYLAVEQELVNMMFENFWAQFKASPEYGYSTYLRTVFKCLDKQFVELSRSVYNKGHPRDTKGERGLTSGQSTVGASVRMRSRDKDNSHQISSPGSNWMDEDDMDDGEDYEADLASRKSHRDINVSVNASPTQARKEFSLDSN